MVKKDKFVKIYYFLSHNNLKNWMGDFKYPIILDISTINGQL
jgi:hypothetical protein